MILVMLQLMGCAAAGVTDSERPTAGMPGWTGTTRVIGNNSTVADDAGATNDQQKWQRGRR